MFYEDGKYSINIAGGDREVQIPFEDITSLFPETVTVEFAEAGVNDSADDADRRVGESDNAEKTDGADNADSKSGADCADSADKKSGKESTDNANNAGYVNNTGNGDNTSHVNSGEGIDNTKGDTLNEEVLSISGWECPAYAEDEERNLPYSGRFFFKARLGKDGEEKEYAFSEDVEEVGVWLVFDEPVTTAAVTAMPGRITSDQEWGKQTLAAGTYTINPGVTVTVSGVLTVNGKVTINGGGKIVRGYAGTDKQSGSDNNLLYVSGGELILENITIDGNQINAYGPAIYISSGTVNLNSGAIIQNNYNMNTSTSGGTYAAGGIYCAGTLNINGGTIQNCKTLGNIGSHVYDYAGGGIYLKGTCNMTSGSITGNSASNGGGVYLASSGAKLTVSGGTISGNKVNSSGAGMGIYYSTLNAATSKLYIGGEGNIRDNIYLDNTSGTLCPEITSALRYKITLKCSSREEGKVLAKGSGYILTGVDASKVTMADSTLFSKLDKVNNRIILSSTEEAEAEWQESSGGAWKTGKFTTALANVYSGGTIRLLTDIVFNEKVEVNKTVTITSKDTANPYTMTRMPTGEYGNITLMGSGNLTLTNIICDGNRGYISANEKAVKQSLIKVGDASNTGTHLTLGSGCTIRDGYKTGGSGVIAVYGNMNMNSGAVIENCEVTGTGGAVWVSPSGTFTMNGGTIRSCKAGDGGSAVSVDGTCNLKGGTITGNTDTSDKNCAVYLRSDKSGNLTLNGISISGNTYSVYNDGESVSVAGNSTLSGSIYTTNAVTASGTAVSGLTNTYTIKMSSVTNGTTVVTGSKDTQHYKLDNAGYGLIPASSGTNLIAAAAYTVTYNKNSGTIANESNYTSYIYGVGLTLPTPTRTNYTFGGWYENSGCTGTKVTGISTTATGNKTYYAKWTVNTYTITYNKNNGTIANESNYTSYTYGTGLTLPTPMRTGYTFGGWYENSSCTGTKVTGISTTATGNKTYYAKWTANTYTITYNKNSGTIANESNYTSYTYGTGLTLPTPTRTGYTFDGWYTTSSFSGSKVTSISTTDYGNKTYYAKWTAKTYKVTFNYQGATGGNSTATKNVTYNGTYGTLPTPTRTGYTFKGWFTQAGGQGSQIMDTTTVKITSAQTLYAYWKDETKPNTPVLQSGVTLPIGWTRTQKTIPLTLYDGVGVTELWVSVDGGTYTKISVTSGSTSYSYTVKEGNHSYRFYAKDAAGNQSGTSTTFSVKLDTAKPVIGELTYANKAADLWQWIIGKKSLLIYVPVTDAGSGVTQIRYTMTPVDAEGNPVTNQAETKETPVNNSGLATISFDKDFKGNISITCEDAAGNQADSVTVSAGGGVIVEENKPVIYFAVNGSAVSGSYYDAAPNITVTVTDQENASGQSMIAGGIASVTYQVGNGSVKTVNHNYAASMMTSDSFTIPEEEIPIGETLIKVTARDHAGNEGTANVTVWVKGAENTPQAVIDYSEEKLTGLAANGQYTVNNVTYTADAQGKIALESGWFNNNLSIVKKGNNSTTLDSAPQSLPVPARPNAPVPEAVSRTDTQITLRQITGVRYRMNDGEWQDSSEFSELTARTKYTFEAFYLSTGNSFRSQAGSAVIATRPAAPGVDDAKNFVVINYDKETFVIPEGVEAFKDPECTRPVDSGEEQDIADYIGGGIYIRYPAEGDFPPSAPTEVPVKGRPSVPVVSGRDETYPGAGNGAVTGLTEGTAYEISDDGGNTWTDAVLTGTEITGLAPGSYQLRVKAGEDHFRSEASTEVIVGTIQPTEEAIPQAGIDYENETLTGLTPGEKYEVNYSTSDGTERTQEYTVDADGIIKFDEDWYGQTVEIVKKGNGKDKLDSNPQSLHVPARPEAPMPEAASRTDTQITLKTITGAEYRIDGGQWQQSPIFTGLTAGTKYTFEARYLPTASSFESRAGSAVIATCLAAPGADSGKDLVLVDYEKETFTIPERVEAFKDPECTQPITSGDEHDITDYIGGGIYIRYPADGDFPASAPTEVPVKGRPSVPIVSGRDETYPGAGNGAVTGLTEGTAYEISDDGGNTWTDAVLSGTEIKGLTPGSYQVRVKAGEDHFKSESSAAVTVGTTQPTEESRPQAGIDYKDENLTDLTPGAKYEVSYTTPDGTEHTQERTADADGKIKFDEDWYGQSVEIVKKGNNKDKLDSNPQNLTVPARPNPPKPETTGESGKGQNNGAITNLTPGENYQISVDGGNTWQDAMADEEGQIKNLPPGSYEVRVKAKNDTFSSESIKCDVKAYPTKGSGHGDRDKVDVDESINNDNNGGETTGTTGGLGTVPNTGVISKEVEKNEKVPDTEISMTTGELAAAVLTDAERQSVQHGASIKIILVVEDAAVSVSSQDKAAMNREKGSYQIGQYLDIGLFKVLGDNRERIAETNGLIRITIAVPDELKNMSSTKTREFAVIRVHDGEAVILHDLDSVEETVTIETNLFSSYALLYRDVARNGNEKAKSGKDDEPKTGDYISLELYATIEMIAGLAYLLLYFADGSCGMTEEEKKELVSRIIKWAHRGGKLRRDLALVAIFLLLVYYHSIGKKKDKKISNIDDWMKISVG